MRVCATALSPRRTRSPPCRNGRAEARAPSPRSAGCDQVALQCLGEVSQLAARRKNWQPDGEGRRSARSPSRCSARTASSSKAARSTSTAAARCITTEECLLSRVQQRNPGMKRRDYEKIFARVSRSQECHLAGLGHCGRRHPRPRGRHHALRFARYDRDLVDADPDDENYEALRENIRRLRDATTEDGKPLAIIELPDAGPGVFRRPAPARELREFLHRQWHGAGAGVQRSQ